MVKLNFIAVALALVAPMAAQSVKRIMPLGDSITGSPGCWRALLWRNLQNANIKNTDFVGTLAAQGCGFTYDGENEGHGGFLATNIANSNQLVGWLSQTKPDIVMMHLGTNDVWSAKSPTEITTAFTKLVGQMRQSKSTMKILVAKIIPMRPDSCQDCYNRVVAFNNEIARWAATQTTSASPVTVVDCWTGFDTKTDTYDGVHPNDAGNQKLAKCWYNPLVSAIRS